ncbi:hypothetical protein V8D89_002387 [Ganoderma adspersum]
MVYYKRLTLYIECLYHLEDEEEDLVKSLLHVAVNTMRKNNPPDYIGNTTYHMSMSSVWHTIHIKSKRCVFLDATYYPNSDLDLYILPNDTLLVLGAYLLHQEYIYIPKEWQQEDFLEDTQHVLATLDVIPNIEDKDMPNYQSKSICTVCMFQRHVTDEDVCSVQVIVPQVSPLHSILAFHSTCVMNIITYNAAFSLYPYATFNRRESLALDMKMHPAEVQDKYSWAIQLDTTGVAIPSSPSLLVSNLAWDPITERGWTLGTHFSHGAEIIVQTPGINLYLSSSPYTLSNFCHILPFLLPPGTLEKMMLDISSSQETVAKTIAWWDLVVPAMRELYGMGQHF